jgi:hypothetical protein
MRERLIASMPDKYDLTPACTLQRHPGARFISRSKSTHTRVQPVGLRTAGQVLHVAGVDQPRVQPAGLHPFDDLFVVLDALHAVTPARAALGGHPRSGPEG